MKYNHNHDNDNNDSIFTINIIRVFREKLVYLRERACAAAAAAYTGSPCVVFMLGHRDFLFFFLLMISVESRAFFSKKKSNRQTTTARRAHQKYPTVCDARSFSPRIHPPRRSRCTRPAVTYAAADVFFSCAPVKYSTTVRFRPRTRVGGREGGRKQKYEKKKKKKKRRACTTTFSNGLVNFARVYLVTYVT